jgi:hypothetical protein
LQTRRGAAFDESFTDDRIGIFVPAGSEQRGAVEQLLLSAGAVEVRHAAS